MMDARTSHAARPQKPERTHRGIYSNGFIPYETRKAWSCIAQDGSVMDKYCSSGLVPDVNGCFQSGASQEHLETQRHAKRYCKRHAMNRPVNSLRLSQ